MSKVNLQKLSSQFKPKTPVVEKTTGKTGTVLFSTLNFKKRIFFDDFTVRDVHVKDLEFRTKQNAVDGYFVGGIFRPIRKSDDYNEFTAGDYDSPEERLKRQEKNAQKAFDWYQEQLEKEMYGDQSLSEYVRRSGGIHCYKPTVDKNRVTLPSGKTRIDRYKVPSRTVEYGEIMRLKEAGKRGLVTHDPKKARNNNADDMRRDADEAGYRWGDQNSISAFLDAVESDASATRMRDKYFPILENPAPQRFKVQYTGNNQTVVTMPDGHTRIILNGRYERHEAIRAALEEIAAKENPSMKKFRVTKSKGNTVVTMPDGKTKITVKGELERVPAIKAALAQYVKKNPALEPNTAAAVELMQEAIAALDMNGDGDLDANDVRRVENFDSHFHSPSGEPSSEVTFETGDENDYLTPDEMESPVIVVDIDTGREGILIDELQNGLCAVEWLDDASGTTTAATLAKPENLMFAGFEGSTADAAVIDNPVKYVLSAVRISNGKRYFMEYDSRMKAHAKRAKLEQTGRYRDFSIKSQGASRLKNNPGLLSIFSEAAVGLASAMQIQDTLAARRKTKTRKAKTNPKAKMSDAALIERFKKHPLLKERIKDFSENFRQKPALVDLEFRAYLQNKGNSQKTVNQKAANTTRAEKLKFILQQKTVETARALAYMESDEPKLNPKTKKNPGMFEAFTGREATQTTEFPSSKFCPKRLEMLGDLWKIKLVGNSEVIDLERNGRFPFKLVYHEASGQMWIVGGKIMPADKSLGERELSVLGEVDYLVYWQEKAHLGDQPGKPSPYKHRLGEEGGERPELCADAEGFPVLDGGDYYLERDIDGQYSAGIRN